jgi:DNA-binding NtrC family response regulator
VVILARHFVDKFCRDLNKSSLALSPAALDDLRAYPWPGNVRELQNCIERAVILSEGDTILPRHLNLSFRQPAAPAAVSPWEQIDLSGTLSEALRRVSAEVERRKVEQALRDAAGNKQRAAELLQIGIKSLLMKQKEFGIAD